MPFGKAQTSTPFSGIITSDTTWTKANSPYEFTGPVAVDNGVTLTIQSGVTVDLNGYYIQVNGTLRAIGKAIDNIIFAGGGRMLFMQSSSPWKEQTSSGCIIENAVLSSDIEMWTASPKINNDTINNYIGCYDGSPLISNNNINNTNAIDIGRGSPIISNNVITATNVYSGGNAINAQEWGSPVVTNNTIVGNGLGNGIYIAVNGGQIEVFDNIIRGFETGIVAGPGSLIERNLISANYYGVKTNWDLSVVNNNTITENTVGVQAYDSPIFVYNNIINNNQNSIYSLDSNDINATYNWWGTTDTQAISQTIHDYKNDFNRGNVTFVPILTEPNPQAMPNPNAPIPTPNPSLTSTSTPNVPEFSSFIIICSRPFDSSTINSCLHNQKATQTRPRRQNTASRASCWLLLCIAGLGNNYYRKKVFPNVFKTAQIHF